MMDNRFHHVRRRFPFTCLFTLWKDCGAQIANAKLVICRNINGAEELSPLALCQAVADVEVHQPCLELVECDGAAAISIHDRHERGGPDVFALPSRLEPAQGSEMYLCGSPVIMRHGKVDGR